MDETRRLKAMIRALRQEVDDLGAEIRDLKAQLAAVAEAAEELDDRGVISSAAAALQAGPPPTVSGGWLKAALRALIRGTVGVARRVWLAADPNQRFVVALGVGNQSTDELPWISVVVETPGDPGSERLPMGLAAQTASRIEVAFWNRGTAEVALQRPDGGEHRELGAGTGRQLARLLGGQYVLGLASPAIELSPTLVETLQWLVASEDLSFVRIVRRSAGMWGSKPVPGEMILASREVWDADNGVDLGRLEAAASSRPVLGKTVGLAGRLEYELPTLGSLGGDSHRVVHRSGRYDVWADNPKGPIPHSISPVPLGTAAASGGERPTVLVIAAAPLEAGIDDVLTGILGQLADDADLVVAATAADHALTLERVARLERSVGIVHELGSTIDWRAWPSALDRLARQHAASTLLLVGTDPRLDPALSGLHARGVRVVMLPVDHDFPDQPVADVWLVCDQEPLARLESKVFDAGRFVSIPVGWPGLADETEIEAGRARQVRAELGVSAGCRLVLSVADLVPRCRPEAVITVADRLRAEPDLRFLLVGEGPLAGSLMDLVRYSRLETMIIRPPSHSVAELVAAADVVLDTADEAPFRASVVAAVASGTPVVTSWGRDVETLLAEGESHGSAVDPICDPSALELAVRAALTRPEGPSKREKALAAIRGRADAGREALRVALAVGRRGPSEE